MARMQLVGGAASLADIEAALGVSRSTASELRQAAAALLEAGYADTELRRAVDPALDLTAA